MRLRWLLVALGLATAGACSAVPDITFGDPDGGPGGPDGAGDTAGPCTPTGPEICDDGIDNDCNRQIDCGDPTCAPGYACVDPAPTGWELVAFAVDARVPCPPGYGAAVDVSSVEGSTSAGCGCTCAVSAGAECSAGSFEITTGSGIDAGACTGNTLAATVPANQPACTAFPGPANIVAQPNQDNAQLTPPPAPAACQANLTKTIPPLVDGRTCGRPARFGAGCPAGQVCAPRAPNFDLCASKAGANECPGTYTRRRSAGSFPVDTRDCSACTCAPSPCSGQVTLYASGSCSAVGQNVTVTSDGPCSPVATQFAQTNAYTATVDGGCAVTADTMATGGLALSPEETICCK